MKVLLNSLLLVVDKSVSDTPGLPNLLAKHRAILLATIIIALQLTPDYTNFKNSTKKKCWKLSQNVLPGETVNWK